MNFYNIEFLYLLILIPIYIYKYKIDKKIIFMLLSFSFIVISISRPILFSKIVNPNSLDVEFVLALDISKSMFAKDIKPNRFEFAKEKIQHLLKNLNGEKLSLLAFSNQSYMIIPSTNNYEIVKTLTNNINIKNINQNGTNFISILKATNEVLNHRRKKALVILTDGGENESFNEEISFANNHNISVYIYDISTKEGSVIEFNNELIKDKNQNIVITRSNKNIENFASSTSGIYLNYSLNNDDFKTILNDIKTDFDNKLNLDDIENKKELFHFSLIFALLFFMLGRFNFRGLR
jgi:Ca-activated chloride channel family protein